MNRFLTLLILSSLAATFPARAAERRPNFLFILADNVGRDWFSCYGSDNPTLNIDRLGSGGARFQHCYVTARSSISAV